MGNENYEGDGGGLNGYESPTDARTLERRPARLSIDTVHRILSRTIRYDAHEALATLLAATDEIEAQEE